MDSFVEVTDYICTDYSNIIVELSSPWFMFIFFDVLISKRFWKSFSSFMLTIKVSRRTDHFRDISSRVAFYLFFINFTHCFFISTYSSYILKNSSENCRYIWTNQIIKLCKQCLLVVVCSLYLYRVVLKMNKCLKLKNWFSY